MTTKFGATSTTDDVLAGLDLKGTRVLVTGTSSGLGIETATPCRQATGTSKTKQVVVAWAYSLPFSSSTRASAVAI